MAGVRRTLDPQAERDEYRAIALAAVKEMGWHWETQEAGVALRARIAEADAKRAEATGTA